MLESHCARGHDPPREPLMELSEVLDEELTALPARYREVLLLCDLEGESRSQVARKLAVPAGTVASRLNRARAALRDRLVRRGVTLGAGSLAAALAQSGGTAPAVPTELTAATVQSAIQYLAGKGAGGIVAATKISSLAQGVLHNMFLTRLSTTVCIVALAAALVLGATPVSRMIDLTSNVRAADIPFLDDFNDGSATDGNPATWTPLPGFSTGTFIAVTGDYVVTQPLDTWPQAAMPNMTPLGDISIRAQVRELQGRGPISLIGRLGNAAAPSGYQAGIEAGGLYIVRTDSPFNSIDLASAATSLNPSVEDVLLQFDIAGSQLSLFAWRAGEDKPDSPNLSATDSTFSSGVAGILIDTPGPGTHSVAFRSIHVANTPIPEPSTAALSSLGIVALAGFVFRARLNRIRFRPCGAALLDRVIFFTFLTQFLLGRAQYDEVAQR